MRTLSAGLATKQAPVSFIATLVAIAAIAGIGLSQWPFVTLTALLAILLLASLARTTTPLVLYFLVFLVLQDALVFFAGGEFSPVGIVLKRADEVILIVYAGILLILNRRVHALLRERTLVLAVAGCYAGMLLSTALHFVGLVPVSIDVVLFSKPFLLLVIGASLDLGDDEIRKFTKPVLYAALVVVLFAVVFLLLPEWQDKFIGDFRAPDQRVGLVSAQGFFDGPGPYSWFCAATFAFGYAAYLILGRTSYLVAAITSGVFLVLSWRRKSIAGMILILLVATVLRDTAGERRRLRAIAALLVLALAALTVTAPYVAGIIAFTDREYGGTDPLANARVALHYTSVLIARDRFPLGMGLATFGSHASRIYYSDTYVQYGLSSVWGLSPEFSGFITDTFWPMVLGEGGVVTLVAYALFLWYLIWQSWKLARSNTVAKPTRFFATFVLFALVASLMESTSSHIYDATMQSALVMIPAGMLFSLRDRARSAAAAVSPTAPHPNSP